VVDDALVTDVEGGNGHRHGQLDGPLQLTRLALPGSDLPVLADRVEGLSIGRRNEVGDRLLQRSEDLPRRGLGGRGEEGEGEQAGSEVEHGERGRRVGGGTGVWYGNSAEA